MGKLEILKTGFIGKGVCANAGDIVDESEVQNPSYLVSCGKAARVETPKPGRPKGAKNKTTKEDNGKGKGPTGDDIAKEKKAPTPPPEPPAVNVTWAQVKAKAKALGIPVKGGRAELEKAIAEAESN